MGKKSWRETFGIIGVKVWSLSKSKFCPWSHLKRTESRFWSHVGQKDRFVIFGLGAPKMGKKSWRETIGVKVRNKILSPGQNFLFTPIWYDVLGWVQSAIPAVWLQSATPALWIRFGTLCQWCVKCLTRIFYPFWVPHSRKLRFGLFDRRATRTWDRSWDATRLVKFPNFSPGESISHRNFMLVNPKVSLQDILLILAALPTKITIRSFWLKWNQMGYISEIFTWR